MQNETPHIKMDIFKILRVLIILLLIQFFNCYLICYFCNSLLRRKKIKKLENSISLFYCAIT